MTLALAFSVLSSQIGKKGGTHCDKTYDCLVMKGSHDENGWKIHEMTSDEIWLGEINGMVSWMCSTYPNH